MIMYTMEQIKENPILIKKIKSQPLEMCLEAVKQNGWALRFIHDRTPTIYLEAVKENGCVLHLIRHQTYDICLAAVKENGWALQFVQEQTPDLCLQAVKQNGQALKYVRQQTYELCLEAVKRDGYALKYVQEQTPDLCLEAVKQTIKAFPYITDKREFTLSEQFGTYNGKLALLTYEHLTCIQAGCWFGNLEEFEAKVWERFELGFKHQTKEQVETIIKQLKEFH